MIKEREELVAEADALGIKYNDRIGDVKLADKIELHYKSLSAGDSIKVKEEVEAEPKAKSKGKSKEDIFREHVAKRKVAAMKTRVVTISSNDKRDSEWTTTAYLSVENQHFGMSKIIPLDIAIELEACLIKNAKDTMIVLHRDEIIEGRRTGNKTPQNVRKFNISYEDISV